MAAHYVEWQRNPKASLKRTAEHLGRPASSMTDVWDELEAHYAADLFEKDGKGRTGRLTPLGQWVGALALQFSTVDYLLRNTDALGDLGDFWIEAFNRVIEDVNQSAKSGKEFVTLIDERAPERWTEEGEPDQEEPPDEAYYAPRR